MLKIEFTGQFKRDYKLALKRGFRESDLTTVVSLLASEKPLPAKYRDHALTGNYIGFRECHIQPDWLLIYSMSESELILTASRTGTHSDLFDE